MMTPLFHHPFSLIPLPFIPKASLADQSPDRTVA